MIVVSVVALLFNQVCNAKLKVAELGNRMFQCTIKIP